jgi:hypothetical protein
MHLEPSQTFAELFAQLHIDLPLLNTMLSEPLAGEATLSKELHPCSPARIERGLTRAQ